MRRNFWVPLPIILLCASCSAATTVTPTPSPEQFAATPLYSITPGVSVVPTGTVIITQQSTSTKTPDLTKTADWAEFQATQAALKKPVENTHSPTPSFTPTPIAPKNMALLIYGDSNKTTQNFPFIERGPFLLTPKILLFSDGHLIISDKKGQLWETYITYDEIKIIFSILETIGFFNLEDASSLYQNVPPGTLDLCCSLISIKATGTKTNNIWADPDFHDYYSQPLKDTISYLDSLTFSGLKPYQPEELMVGIQNGNFMIDDPETARPWPEGVTAPDRAAWDGVLTLKGAEAKKMLSATSGKIYYHLFSYNGKKYTAILRPIYPHECLVREYEEGDDPSTASAWFLCENW